MTDPMQHPFKRLLMYARQHRREVYLATLYSVLNKIFDLAPPALIGAAVDTVVRKEDSFLAELGIASVMDQLWVLAGLTVVIWGLESVFEYLYAWAWRNLAQTLQHELRLDAYSHMQRLDTSTLEDQRTGRLMSILNDDVNQLERFLDGGANDLLQVGTTVIVVGATFFIMSPTLAVLAALPVPLVLWGSFKFQARIAPRYAEVREQASLLNARFSNNLGGMETIKSFTAESFELGQVRKDSDAYRASNRAAIALSAAFTPLIRMAIVVGFVATLVYGGHLTQTGELAIGSYSVLVFLTQRLLWPLTSLGQTFDLFQRGMASAARILHLLDTPYTLQSGPKRLRSADVKGSLTFEGVDFGYLGRETVLRGIDLEIPAGRTLGVVGATGSGKSTLMKLILRFYDPDGGAVRIDGQDLKTLDLQDLRGAIGLVSQSVFLFHGTVAENIAYGRPGASREEIRAAAASAEALEFIEALPQGFDTLVGERGQKLSGGQRQRISIARAVLKDPRVLILDEATSAVDNETEAAIQRSMAHIAQGRTTLVVAHRLSTIRQADEIIVLEGGRIVERGRHDALVAQGGIYERLWRVQTGDNKAAA